MTPIPKTAPGAKRLMQVLMGGAGLILLGGGGVLVGLNSRLTGLETQASKTSQEVSSSEQITKRYQQTQATFDETQSRIKFLETSVSAKSYVPTLLSQLQALATQTHLTVTAVRPAAPAPPAAPVAKTGTTASADASNPKDAKKQAPPPYDTLLVDVNVSGSYANTAAFLYGLTRFPKILSVAGAQMRPGSAGANADPNAPPVIDTSLKLIAFVFPDTGSDNNASSGATVIPAVATVPAVPVVPVTPAGPKVQKSRATIPPPAAQSAGFHPGPVSTL